MCAFPSASWPAWTWLADCLEKWQDINKIKCLLWGVVLHAGFSILGLAGQFRCHHSHQPTIISLEHHRWPLLRMDTHLIIRRFKLTIPTDMGIQGFLNKTSILPDSWREISFLTWWASLQGILKTGTVI